MKNPVIREVLDWTLHIVIAVVIGLLMVKFVIQITIVNGQSMEHTLINNDILLIEKISPKLDNFKYGDIVTIDVKDVEGASSEKSPIIKRVIGVEGDKIEIKEGKVYVNGELKIQDYTKNEPSGEGTQVIRSEYASLTVQKGYIYVLGDNRTRGGSLDSRSIGPLETKRVLGKVLVRLFPFSRIGTLEK
ncbi:MAG: signal peptidase I [Clostridia bacterium]|nr:signal peptidase I [Clostridia bacterium]